MFKGNVALPSAKNLIGRLCDYAQDEEKINRLEVLNNTYLKGLNGNEIKGVTQLLETLTTIHGGNKGSATKILKNICQVLDEEEDGSSKNGATQLLIQLAKDNTLLFFKDQYDITYAKVKVAQHSEIIALGSGKFEYFVSKIYYDYTRGEVVGQESLNNAIRVLVAQTLFDSTTTRTLNLRVAWGEQKGRGNLL